MMLWICDMLIWYDDAIIWQCENMNIWEYDNVIEHRYGKTMVFDDFGGCEESITFQNRGNP